MSSDRTISDDGSSVSSTQSWRHDVHKGFEHLKQMSKKQLVKLVSGLRGVDKNDAKLMKKQDLYNLLKMHIAGQSSSSVHTSISPTDLLGSKNCGPKQGENRWTKPDLVNMAVAHRGIAKSKASKMCISDLCDLLRHNPSPRGRRHSSGSPRGRSHSSGSSGSNDFNRKKCGPKKGPLNERWTKAELVQLAMDRNLVTHKSHASKMTLGELCALIKGPASAGRTSGSSGSTISTISSLTSPRSSSSSQGILGHAKNCGPKKGANRWTKPELVELAVHHKNYTKYRANKMSVGELCALLK
jgi:hypothetical protein